MEKIHRGTTMTMTKPTIPCHFCGGEAQTKDGVIYVRHKLSKSWGSVEECRQCWELKRHEQ